MNKTKRRYINVRFVEEDNGEWSAVLSYKDFQDIVLRGEIPVSEETSDEMNRIERYYL